MENPDLTGRTAECGCGSTEPSSEKLAFFSFRGTGSRAASESCKNCGFYECAHDPAYMSRNVPSNRKTVVEQGKCSGFTAHGPFEFDRYYCGHAGWE